jgi:hypothetical protein
MGEGVDLSPAVEILCLHWLVHENSVDVAAHQGEFPVIVLA